VVDEFLSVPLDGKDCARIELEIRGDSNLIISQLQGHQECRHEGLRPLYLECKSLLEEIKNVDTASSKTQKGSDSKGSYSVEISYEHIYRENNKEADRLANEAMDEQKCWVTRDEVNPVDEKNQNERIKV